MVKLIIIRITNLFSDLNYINFYNFFQKNHSKSVNETKLILKSMTLSLLIVKNNKIQDNEKFSVAPSLCWTMSGIDN